MQYHSHVCAFLGMKSPELVNSGVGKNVPLQQVKVPFLEQFLYSDISF